MGIYGYKYGYQTLEIEIRAQKIHPYFRYSLFSEITLTFLFFYFIILNKDEIRHLEHHPYFNSGQ